MKLLIEKRINPLFFLFSFDKGNSLYIITMKAGEHFEKYFYLDNQSYMVNTEGLTTEQVAEIDALKAQVEDANNARAEFEEKNRELGDKIYKLKKAKQTIRQLDYLWRK